MPYLSGFISRREPLVLVAILVVVMATWGFFELADKVVEGRTQTLDTRIMNALRKPGEPTTPIGPKWLTTMVRDVTALGGFAVLSLVVGSVIGFLFIAGKYRMVVLMLIATLGALVINVLAKQFVDRPRPPQEIHLMAESSASFPSGHSTLSAAVFLTLGSLLAQTVKRKRLKFYFLGCALLATLLVGLSRIYLGVHYPTDVLAGWASGLVWALLCWLVARYLQRRGSIEQEDEDVAPVLDPKP
jgi:undecaprenyl-diphosphatase